MFDKRIKILPCSQLRGLMLLLFCCTECLSQNNDVVDRKIWLNENSPKTSVTSSISADSAWATRPAKSHSLNIKNATMELAENEVFNKKDREWAVRFVTNYPQDRRIEEAILIAINARVFYWKDPMEGARLFANYKNGPVIPIDTQEQSAWAEIYPNLRSLYLALPGISAKEKLIFRKGEIFRTLLGSRTWSGEKLSPDSLLLIFEDAIIATKKLDPSDIYNKIGQGNVFSVMEAIFNLKNAYGWTNDDLQLFMEKTAESKIKEVKNWGQQHLGIMKLKKVPLILQHEDINGEMIDLANYKGKVILIDFWATWCGSCIKGMEHIKEAYAELHRKGFEVISVSINAQSEINDVLNVKSKVGFSWPLMIIGGKNRNDKDNLYQKIWSTYGFSSLPQLLLLDKNGKLVEYKGALGSNSLGRIVEKYL